MFELQTYSLRKSAPSRPLRARLRALVVGLVLAAAITEAQASAATLGSSAARTSRTNATDELLLLGPEGHALAKRAGVWDVTFTSWNKPGTTPVTLTGLVAERRMIGPMLQEILHTVPSTSGRPFTRVDDLTFNRLEGRWEYMSMDTRAPDGLMTAESLDRDSEKRIFINFQPLATPADVANVMGQFLRMEEIIIRVDADHEVKEQYFMPADGVGKKWLAIRYAYARKASH